MTDANSREAHLRLALQGLDDANPALWDVDGFPILDQVKRLSGISHLSRHELNAIGRVRDMSKANGPAASVVDSFDTVTAASESDAAENVAECQRQLDAARNQENAATARLRKARAGIALAIQNWTIGAKRNPTDVLRENVKRDADRKRAIVEGKVAPPQAQPVANSEIDRIAAGTRGGNGRPGGLAWRRGATPTPGGRVKMPSQR